eukprot:gnl/TRDRNA2_/TRDRNA2_75221_c0_seq1.p1 gnl/TRDRNA2_/TRDRNA2_75221_c0~~gnl/TRDRNA2_/TRDRNA2_75221_c0_seq1.p1  ORF type:complete len:495 (-),score=67.67 gnl/TRDRNA2_/TRDRNA2_75221_c0_seq1:40-1425(-)
MPPPGMCVPSTGFLQTGASEFCKACHTVCDRADTPVPELPLVDLKVDDLLQSEEFALCQWWEPFPSGALCFHSSLPKCVVRGTHGVCAVVDYQKASDSVVRKFNVHQLGRMKRHASPSTSFGASLGNRPEPVDVTQMTLINEHSHGCDDLNNCLLCCAADDGAVHIIRRWGCERHAPSVVCAFQALPRRQNAALCIHWCQSTARLVSAGRDPQIRIWDLAQEQMLHSFNHNIRHCVTCVTQCASAENGTSQDSVFGNLVCVGCGDGSLLLVDSRIERGVAQSYKCHTESVTTVTPGVLSTDGAEPKMFAIASSDAYGAVNIWDVRSRRSHATYQLGTRSATERSLDEVPQSPLRRACSSPAEPGMPTKDLPARVPTLCHALEYRGLIASAKLAPAGSSCGPAEISLVALENGERRAAFPLLRDVCPLAMGFHPTRQTFGILVQDADDSRLLLYGSGAMNKK